MTITVTIPGPPPTPHHRRSSAINALMESGEFGNVQEFISAALEWCL